MYSYWIQRDEEGEIVVSSIRRVKGNSIYLFWKGVWSRSGLSLADLPFLNFERLT